MKRLLIFPLLAFLLLLTSCDGPAPTELDSGAVSPALAKATMTLNLHAYCPTCTAVDGNTFYTDGDYRAVYYFACPATKGAIQLYRCMDKAGFYLPAAECEGGNGRWQRSTIKKVLPDDPCNSVIASFYGNISGTSQGWKLEYSPRGSGYYKAEFIWNMNQAAGPT
jgi:hypothetical protein